MKIVSAEQQYNADKITIEKEQITSLELMERAGGQIFEWLDSRLEGVPVPVHIFCGIGDNGGDGMVVGRLLIEHGYNVVIYVVNYSDKRSENFLYNYDRIKKVTKNWPIIIKREAHFPKITSEDVVIDAIFGIGLSRSPEGWVKKLITYLNETEAFKLSIDIPSGLFANKALEDEEAVFLANHTLTFQAPKLAFFLPKTAPFVRDFEVLDIGLDSDFLDDLKPLAHLITLFEAKNLYKYRDKYAHKGTFGHALIVGGSYGKIGAAVLASKAAFKIGAGLVTAFVPKCGYNILQTTIPEAMVATDKEDEIITNIAIDFEPTAIGIGMGIGKNKATAEALTKLFKTQNAPMVIDADALNILAENKEVLKLLPKSSILTPHPGELKRLIGAWKDDYEKLEKVKKFSKKNEAVVIIKGAFTTIVYMDNLYINSTGNPGMATGGSGDALTGAITGLLCQGYNILQASLFGVYLHGLAGDNAANVIGYEALMASDIIDNLGKAYMELFTNDMEEPE